MTNQELSKEELIARAEKPGKDAMKLHPSHEQLDKVIVDGPNVRIKKLIVPYKDDMANITINELNWTNAFAGCRGSSVASEI